MNFQIFSCWNFGKFFHVVDMQPNFNKLVEQKKPKKYYIRKILRGKTANEKNFLSKKAIIILIPLYICIKIMQPIINLMNVPKCKFFQFLEFS